MYCPHCGAKCPDSDRYCYLCGQPLESKRSGWKLPVFVTIGVIVVLLTVFALLQPFGVQLPLSFRCARPVPAAAEPEDPASTDMEANADTQDGGGSIPEAYDENLPDVAPSEYGASIPLPEPLSGESGTWSDSIYKLNAEGAAGANAFDPFARNREPAARNLSLYWEKRAYDSINDGIDSYSLERKQLVDVNGTRIEYEIYRNPNSNRINKIISFEVHDNNYSIIDYYFDDGGTLLFIYVRTRPYYAPERAVLSNDGERYFFRDDVMTKWRTIANVGDARYEYAIGENEYAHNKRSGVYCTYYQDLNADLQREFDEREIKWLNAAYNTLAAVKGDTYANTSYSIQGSVCSENKAPVGGAVVELYSDRVDEVIYRCSTNADGSYAIAIPECTETFSIYISQKGCRRVTIYGIEITTQTVITYLETVTLVPRTDIPVSVELVIGDAFNTDSSGATLPVDNAAVKVRHDFSNRSGAIVSSGVSDAQGRLRMSLLPGCYTAQIDKDGYITAFMNFVVLREGDQILLTITPTIGSDEVRIVLTWGDMPPDLDSHLFMPSGDHIYYGDMRAEGGSLDVDDTSSYGPETVTIQNLGSGSYKYYVVDFTNCSSHNFSSTEMSRSGATVQVYAGAQLISTFHVPTNTTGLIWEVFEIRDGQVVPIQRYYNNIDDKDWWYSK